MKYSHTDTAAVYFAVVGDFDPHEFAGATDLRPLRAHTASDLRPDGSPYGFSACYTKKIKLETEGRFPPDLTAAAHELMDVLEARGDALRAFAASHTVDYTLEVVLYLDPENEAPHPALPTEKELMARLLALDISLDIDYYID